MCESRTTESDGSSIINLCLESKRVISKKSKKERELKFSRLCDSCHGSSETSKTNYISGKKYSKNLLV